MEMFFAWLFQNRGTVIVMAILIAAFTLIVVGMVRNKKKGKGGCGCGCEACALRGKCHNE